MFTSWVIAALFRALALSSLLFISACNRSAEYYLAQANQYFKAGKYSDASLNYRKAIQKNAHLGEAYYGLGQAELRQSREREAFQAWTRAVELMPEHTEANERFAELCLTGYLSSQNRPKTLYDKLIEISDRLLSRNPNSYQGLRVKGYLALTDRKMGEAIQTFRRANELRPMQPDVVLALAQALIQENQAVEGEKLAEALLEKNKTFGQTYDLLYGRYTRTGRRQQAEDLLKSKVANNPKQAAYRIQLATHYLLTGKRAEMEFTLSDLLQNPADFPQARLSVGDFYSNMRNFQEAERHYQEGLKTASKDDKLVYQRRLVTAFRALSKKDEALKLLDTIIRESPDDTQAIRTRAQLQVEIGKSENIEAAIADLQALLSKNPKSEAVRYEFGLALRAKGDLDAARRQLLEAAALRKTYLLPRFALAEVSMQQGQPGEALRYAGEILEHDPRHYPTRLLRATAFRALANYNSARTELNRLLKEAPDSIDVKLQLALLDLAEKRFKDAETGFLKLYQPGSRNLRPLAGLVETYAAQNQLRKAIGLLNDEVKKNPNSRQVRTALAGAAVRAGDYTLAVEQYQQLLSTNPGASGIYAVLSHVYQMQGDRNSAIAALRKAIEIQPDNKSALMQLAGLLSNEGATQEALALYRRLQSIDPSNIWVLNNLAYLLAESGANLDEAIQMVQRALKAKSGDPHLSDTLGYVYLKRNQNDPAMQIFSSLVTKYPQNPTYRVHLAMALLQKGAKAEAKKQLESALYHKPGLNQERKIRAMLAEIG